MMSHQEIQERIHPYVDGELDAGNARELELHLSACEQCRGIEQRIRALRDALSRSEPGYRAPARLQKNVRKALRLEAKPSRQTWWLVLATGAACTLLLLAFAVFQTAIEHLHRFQLRLRQAATRIRAFAKQHVGIKTALRRVPDDPIL